MHVDGNLFSIAASCLLHLIMQTARCLQVLRTNISTLFLFVEPCEHLKSMLKSLKERLLKCTKPNTLEKVHKDFFKAIILKSI